MGQDPWGLSGEQFLEWYFIALGCAVALAVVIRYVPKFRGGGNHVFRPSAVETGFLAAGPDRAVATAAAELLASGAARIGSSGLIQSVRDATRSSAVGSEVLARAASGHSLRDICGHLRSRAALHNVGNELAALGLVVPAYMAARIRFASTLPVLLVLVVGVVRWGNGLILGRAVGFLTGALIGTVVLVFVMLNFRRGRHLRTFAGDRALRELRRGTARDAATAVALDGVDAYPEARTAAALRRSQQPPISRSRGVGAGAAASGGFFIGGGGGGCGGGGGGGCGGGGGGGGGGCGG